MVRHDTLRDIVEDLLPKYVISKENSTKGLMGFWRKKEDKSEYFWLRTSTKYIKIILRLETFKIIWKGNKI